MITPRNLYFVIFCLFLSVPNLVLSQDTTDIYSKSSTQEYAAYLLASGQYQLAALEYQRLSILDPVSKAYKEKTAEAMYKGGLFESLSDFVTIKNGNCSSPENLAKYHMAANLNLGNYSALDSMMRCNASLSENIKQHFEVVSLAYKGKWKNAYSLSSQYNENPFITKYSIILGNAAEEKRVSPLLAGVMSGIIPGSGKFYARDWKNGLISLVFIGVLGYQSYYGFNQKGLESGLGWVYGTLGFGFYIGNVVGSVSSANRYNALKNQSLINRFKPYLLP